jgi:nucleoside-diphosphate-sugar epimerase
MKLFVTGGTGFVGTHFIAQALAAGHEVVALRRPGSQPRLPLPAEPQWLDGALDDDWSDALRGCEALVHLASHTPNPPYAPLDECLYWNVFAAMKLARQAAAAGVGRFLVAGSCFEYGQVPGDLEFIDASTPLAPTLSYPISKAAASVAFEGFAREHGHRVKILRIFQVYGEGEQATRMWPSLRRAALAGEDFPMSAGDQVRDFVAVEDVAAAFLRHLDFADATPGQPLIRHVGSGRSQTLLEFARHWWSTWGATGALLPGRMPYRKNELFRLVPHPETLA